MDLNEESSMTLSQWLDKWLDVYMAGTVRESILDGYRRDLNNHVKPYLGGKPLLKVTPSDLTALYQTLLERGRVGRKKASDSGLSPTTVHGIHTTLHHVLRTVGRGDGTMAKKRKRGEGSLHLRNVLRRYREESTSRWMFPSPKKEYSPMDPATIRKKLAAVLERAGCRHLRFHDLRHTFATNALGHGMDIKTLSAIIGHVSSATTLNVYVHVTDEMRQRAADRIDRVYHQNQRPPMGGAVLPEAQRKARRPKCLRPNRGGV